MALEQVRGIIGFFQKDVPAAFEEVKDRKLLAEFRQTNQAVIERSKLIGWLQNDLLPRPRAISASAPRTIARSCSMTRWWIRRSTGCSKIGYDDLHRNQQWFQRAAAQIDPASAAAILAELEKTILPPGKLLDGSATCSAACATSSSRHIVTIPSPVLPIVEETPPFMRALTSASMDTPGTYEQVAKEAFFNVTLPEPDWTPRRGRVHGQFNRGTIVSTAVHEAIPATTCNFCGCSLRPPRCAS